MSASKLSRMDQLLSRNGSIFNEKPIHYRSNSSFESQLNFVKGQQDRNQQSTYMHSNTKTESFNIFNNHSNIPLTNRLPPSNKKQSYYTPQKINRQILSSSIYDRESSQQRNDNSCKNIRNHDAAEFFQKSEFKDISSIKKKTPTIEKHIDYDLYESEQQKINETPCQKILKSYEKENCLLKSELSDHNQEMKEINKKIRDMEKENRKLRNALQQYIDQEEKEDKMRIQKESEIIYVLKEEIAKQHVLNTKLGEKINFLQQQNLELDQEKEKYYKKCVLLAKKLKSFQGVKLDLQEKIYTIEPELDKQQIKNELLEQDARHLQMELDFWRQKAEDQEYEMLKLKRNDEKLRIKIQEYEDIEAQDKEKQFSELNQFKAKLKQTEIENLELKEQVKKLKTELGSSNYSEESTQDIIANLKAKLHVETAKLENITQREREQKKKIEELEKQLKQVKEKNDNLEMEKVRLEVKQQIDEDIEGANYEKVIERSKNKAEDINRDQNYVIEKLQRDLQTRDMEIMQLKENFDSLYLQLIENQNMLKEEINLKNKVEQEKQAQIIELNQIKKEISKYKENLENFKQNLTDSQQKAPRSSRIFDNTDQSNNFNEKIKLLESTIADVQNKKKQVNQDNQMLKQRLQSLDCQLSHRSQASSSNLSQQ
ncbi:hypothetical protein ABPG74_009007 [Tetrahymena malaccensis]